MSVLGVRTKESTKIAIFKLANKTYGSRNGRTEPTIADILSIDPEKKFAFSFCEQRFGVAYSNRNNYSAKAFHDIRKKLIKHGFTEKDGPFLYFATEKYYVDKIIEKESVSAEEATIGVKIADKMGWIKMLP